MKFKYILASLLIVIFSTLIQAEEIIQTQKYVQCKEGYALATPGNLLEGQDTTVTVDLPKSSWYLGQYTFIPEFTGELTVSFSGGSKTTSWWVGEKCVGSESIKATDKASYTQTIHVTAGEEVYITAYDWYQAKDIKLVFKRAGSLMITVENIIQNNPILTGKDLIEIKDLKKVYFIGNDSVHGDQLWVSDGTVKGTHILTPPNPDIIQTQKNVSCEESYLLKDFNTYNEDSMSSDPSYIVGIPEGTWYLGRYHFTPSFTGELEISFDGGSETTNWWVGTECGSRTGGRDLVDVANKAAHTQTIHVTAGEKVYITAFDWYQAKNIRISIHIPGILDEGKIERYLSDIKKFNNNLFFSINYKSYIIGVGDTNTATAYKLNLQTNELVSLSSGNNPFSRAGSANVRYKYISDKYAVMAMSEADMDNFDNYTVVAKHDTTDPVIARVLSMEGSHISGAYYLNTIKETEDGLYIHGVNYDKDKEVCVFFNGNEAFTKEETMVEKKYSSEGDELEKRYDTACGKNGNFEI